MLFWSFWVRLIFHIWKRWEGIPWLLAVMTEAVPSVPRCSAIQILIILFYNLGYSIFFYFWIISTTLQHYICYIVTCYIVIPSLCKKKKKKNSQHENRAFQEIWRHAKKPAAGFQVALYSFQSVKHPPHVLSSFATAQCESEWRNHVTATAACNFHCNKSNHF